MKSILVFCAVTVLCLAITSIHFVAPFVVLALLTTVALCIAVIRQNRQLRNATFRMAVFIFLLLCPIVLFLGFAEKGFQDGPFYGRTIKGDLTGLAVSESVPYRDGRIIISNRSNGQSPVMYYVDRKNKMKWAVEMDVSMNPMYRKNRLSRVGKMKVQSGVFRDKIEFLGTWDYGAEGGYAFISKFSGFQRFYLSW